MCPPPVCFPVLCADYFVLSCILCNLCAIFGSFLPYKCPHPLFVFLSISPLKIADSVADEQTVAQKLSVYIRTVCMLAAFLSGNLSKCICMQGWRWSAHTHPQSASVSSLKAVTVAHKPLKDRWKPACLCIQITADAAAVKRREI